MPRRREYKKPEIVLRMPFIYGFEKEDGTVGVQVGRFQLVALNDGAKAMVRSAKRERM